MKKVKQYKISRRLNLPVFEKCQTQSFVLKEQRRVPKRRRGIMSEFNKQLLEKQKLKYLYNISEKELKNYYKKSIASRTKNAEEALMNALESRLDNIVYRMGLAGTRRMARQMTSHGHFLVNSRRTTIPSRQIKVGEKIGIREGSKNTTLLKGILQNKKSKQLPWAVWDSKTSLVEITDLPNTDEVLFSISSVLEYYSR